MHEIGLRLSHFKRFFVELRLKYIFLFFLFTIFYLVQKIKIIQKKIENI